MTNERHPDIEIYIKQQTVEQIVTWLQSRFADLTPTQKKGNTHHFKAQHEGHSIAVMLIYQAAKDFSSLWFDSSQTPWATDLDCARQAQQQLGTEIRCIASGWNEGDEPDEWWSVTNNGENKILWRG